MIIESYNINLFPKKPNQTCYCIEITKISWTTWILWPEILEAGNIFKNTCCVNFFKNFLTKNTWCIWNHVVPGIFAYNLKEVFWKKINSSNHIQLWTSFLQKNTSPFTLTVHYNVEWYYVQWILFFNTILFQVYLIILLYIPKFKIKRHLYYLHILK